MSHIAFTHLRHSVPSSPCFFLVRRAFRKPGFLRPEAKSEGRNTCPWRRRIGLRSIWTDWTLHHKWTGAWWAAPVSAEGAGWCCLRPLLIISERSSWSEEVSEDYKKAKVHPVFKKEDPVSYRLVSIMSVPEDNESWSPFSEVKWQLSDREEPVGTNWNTGGSVWTSGNTSLLWGGLGAGASCREVVQSASGMMLQICLGTALEAAVAAPAWAGEFIDRFWRCLLI